MSRYTRFAWHFYDNRNTIRWLGYMSWRRYSMPRRPTSRLASQIYIVPRDDTYSIYVSSHVNIHMYKWDGLVSSAKLIIDFKKCWFLERCKVIFFNDSKMRSTQKWPLKKKEYFDDCRYSLFFIIYISQ